jgi:hypothetical protein
VVAVHGVLDRELPVPADAVQVRAGDDLEAAFRVVDHEVEVIARVREVVAEWAHAVVERHEHEAAVVLEARDLAKAHRLGE